MISQRKKLVLLYQLGGYKMSQVGRNILAMPDFMVTMVSIDLEEGQSLTQLHFNTLITYSHLHLLVKKMVEQEWVFVKKQGRERRIYLTEKGRTITGHLKVLFQEMNISIYTLKEIKRKKTGKNKNEAYNNTGTSDEEDS